MAAVAVADGSSAEGGLADGIVRQTIERQGTPPKTGIRVCAGEVPWGDMSGSTEIETSDNGELVEQGRECFNVCVK